MPTHSIEDLCHVLTYHFASQTRYFYAHYRQCWSPRRPVNSPLPREKKAERCDMSIKTHEISSIYIVQCKSWLHSSEKKSYKISINNKKETKTNQQDSPHGEHIHANPWNIYLFVFFCVCSWHFSLPQKPKKIRCVLLLNPAAQDVGAPTSARRADAPAPSLQSHGSSGGPGVHGDRPLEHQPGSPDLPQTRWLYEGSSLPPHVHPPSRRP